jgi:hypothetical protein
MHNMIPMEAYAMNMTSEDLSKVTARDEERKAAISQRQESI